MNTDHVKKHNFWLKDDHQLLATLNTKYHSMTTSETTNFPPLVHFIWLGPNPQPKTFPKIFAQWQSLNPSFEVKLWQESDLPSLSLINSKVILNTELNPALRADFLRVELLY
jgi:mannosyltransferase OCH1-like enzyme